MSAREQGSKQQPSARESSNGGPKQVGIWIRVSTEDQARGESPEHHERRARAYATAKGWRIREVYHLEGVSGKAVMEHPEAKRMLEDIASGHITGLIFSKLARLARNTRELLDLADSFKEQGADLVSLQESIDTSSPAGRLFYTMIAAMAQWEREEIAERVAASVPIRAKLGKPLGGAAPFGYQWKDKELVPDPKEAPIRRLLYDLFLEHKRKKTVARILNERGHRTRRGAKFSDTTVARLLEDPTAKGVRRANYTRSTGEGKHWELKPEDDWIHVPVEPIISEETWDQIQAILASQKARRKPSRKAKHLFTGLAVCDCGKRMYVPSGSRKYICYDCRNKIAIDDLETVFQEQLKGYFLSPEDVVAHLQQADEELQKRTETLKSLEAERGQLTRQMDKILKAYTEDELALRAFGRQYRPLEERLEQIENEIPRVEGEIDFMRIQHLTEDQILGAAQGLFERWPTLEPEEKRQIVESVVEEIRVGKTEVAIDLCYLPSPQDAAERPRNFRGSWRPRR